MSEWLGWTQTILAAVTTVATVLLAVYAYGIIREMKKDRARITAENMLQNIFQPLYEILRRARFEDSVRSAARQKPLRPGDVGPRDYALEKAELKRIQDLIEKFGYYLDNTRLIKFDKIIDRFDTVEVDIGLETKIFYRFHNGDMDWFFDYVMNQREELRKQLQLTR